MIATQISSHFRLGHLHFIPCLMPFSRWLQPHDVHLPIASQSLFKLFSFLPDSGLWQWSCCALFLPLCNCDVYSDRRLQSKTRGSPLVQVFVEFVNFMKLITAHIGGSSAC